MNFRRYHVSKNLFDKSKRTDNSRVVYTTGEIGALYGVFVSDFTPILPNTTYTLNIVSSMSSKTRHIFALYDENKNFVNTGAHETTSATIYTFTTPSNVAYIRFNGNMASVDSIMLNVGSIPLPYEPYSSEVWHGIPYYIHKTDTDTITTLPAVLYPTGTTAIVGLKGNEQHTGTPTPDNPIMPQGTGERTENLWNAEGFSARAITSTHEHTNTNSYGTTISSTIGKEVSVTQADYPTGNVGYQNGFFFLDVDFSKYSIGDVITLSFDYIVDDVHALSTQTSTTLYAGKNNNTITPILSSGDWKISGRLIAVITIIADMSPYVEVRLCGNSITVKNIMLNSGSTALPYEPYGIKIPISSANTTTPVYLGEVETTRKIRKYEFTGQETFNKADSTTETGTAVFSIRYDDIGMRDIIDYYEIMADISYPVFICSHFKMKTNTSFGTPYTAIKNGEIGANSVDSITYNRYVIFASNQYTTADDFKTYLQQQYANGTPVTVWYVLAEPETGIVNEPLMRIGDYADTLSGISIPVTAGGDTLSVGTTVQPSEVTATYKGWHPVADVHEFTGNYTVGTMQTLPISELETHTISDLQGGEWS